MFGSAARCEAWLRLAVSPVRFFWAAPLFRDCSTIVTGEPQQGTAQIKNHANGKAEPCLTTGGKAEAESSGFLGGTPIQFLSSAKLTLDIHTAYGDLSGFWLRPFNLEKLRPARIR